MVAVKGGGLTAMLVGPVPPPTESLARARTNCYVDESCHHADLEFYVVILYDSSFLDYFQEPLRNTS